MSSLIILRTVYALAFAPGLVACTAPTSASWQKPGATEATIASDSSECRALAEQEAARLYPFDAGSGVLGPAGVTMAQQRDYMNRSNAELSLFGACMQNRGYTRTGAAR